MDQEKRYKCRSCDLNVVFEDYDFAYDCCCFCSPRYEQFKEGYVNSAYINSEPKRVRA